MKELLYLSEQFIREKIKEDYAAELRTHSNISTFEKEFTYRKNVHCYKITIEAHSVFAYTNYLVGVDWLVQDSLALYVEPKLNNEKKQIDYLGMLLSSLEAPENLEHLEGLFHVEYDKPWITIPAQKDILSPILIIQFLKLVEKIVRKGLKKSYYRITESLNSRVKGKILVGQQIKENIVKNKVTKTVCNFQEFGINTEENQFLKFVLNFVSSYINQNKHIFGIEYHSLKCILNYCVPSFEQVGISKNKHQCFQVKKNLFYKEYEEVIKIGNYILKRFSFNINKIAEIETSVPPFWIDMSKLFELYVYKKLKEIFPVSGELTYHDKYLGGKETDILIRAKGFEFVVDCKYKPQYENHEPSLEDKRQLAGYTRLRSVYAKLGIDEKEIVRGLIIYSHQSCSEGFRYEDLFKTPIKEYIEFYKLGVRLPDI